MQFPIQIRHRSPVAQGGRSTLRRCRQTVLTAVLSFPGAALADPLFTLPAPPVNVPLLPSMSEDWTLKFGIEGAMAPSFEGAKSLRFSPKPIFSIQRSGTPDRFHSYRDSPSFALFDFGAFRAGPLINVDMSRRASSNSALYGLGNTVTVVQAGGFGEYYPVDWFRTRIELRDGIGRYGGFVADLSADAIVPLTPRLTFSAGPRFRYDSASAISQYFSVDTAQSLASGLPYYSVSRGSYSPGIGAQLGYRLTPSWEVHSFVEYERLLGSAAAAPLVKLRGSPNQVTVGLGVSYSFDFKVR